MKYLKLNISYFTRQKQTDGYHAHKTYTSMNDCTYLSCYKDKVTIIKDALIATVSLER